MNQCLVTSIGRRAALAAAVFLGMLWGCGPEGIVLDVTVSGLTDEVRVLAVTPTLGGAKLRTQTLSSRLDSFLVRLPPGTLDRVGLSVSGQTKGGCEFSHAEAEIPVAGLGAYAAHLTLQENELPGCGIVIEKTGKAVAAAHVVSTPAGIDCGAQCSAVFPIGSKVSLSTDVDPGFIDCPAVSKQLCEVVISERGIKLSTASFSPSMISLWGSGSRELWGIGLDGFTVHWDGAAWTGFISKVHNPSYCLAGDGAGHLWVCGDGTISPLLAWTGSDWERVTNVTRVVTAIWSSGPGDTWAVGDGIWHWNGKEWAAQDSSDRGSIGLFGVWGSGPNDVWAVGDFDLVLRWNGTAWRAVSGIPMGNGGALRQVGGSGPRDVWVLAKGSIYRWDGAAWTKVPIPNPDSSPFRIWVSALNDVWAIDNIDTEGKQQALSRWNGTTWNAVPVLPAVGLTSMWGSASNDVWVAASDRSILHWDGTRFSVAY